MKTLWRVIAAVIGFFALALQYYIIAADPDPPDLVIWTINFLSFFTILSNSLAALAMAVPALAPQSGLGRFFNRPSVRTAIAAYIVIVAVIYHLVLRHAWDPQGSALVADVLLHYVTPTLFVLDWLLMVPKGSVPWSTIWKALVVPLIYIGWTLGHGAQTGWYPYPFVNVTKLGLEKVLMNSAGLFGVFMALTAVLTGFNRLLGLFLGRRNAVASS
jgi:hypothetical protein